MTKFTKCPDCLAMEALRVAVEKQGRQWKHGQTCQTCKGSGRVREMKRAYDKRRKEMSGEEWTEYDARFERERERMEKDE